MQSDVIQVVARKSNYHDFPINVVPKIRAKLVI